ncbi:MAG: cytochrome-c peroxidase [Saprospiraceae bacterium]|nr:cytochrome-c peroxidase [Saprospiraceae bacterium]
MKRISFVFTFFLLVILACSDKSLVTSAEENLSLPNEPYAYDKLSLPVGSSIAGSFDDFTIDNNVVTFSNNKTEITPWGATLGRVLFYDKKLSLNNTVSCASCHHQEKAFADGLQFSTGFEGRVTTRNSMAIVNPILQNNLFWDSRSKTIHDLSLQPVQNHIEMGMEDLNRLVSKLENTEYYKPLFKKAFGTNEINPTNISKALSQFVASITTSRSRFDAGSINNFNNFSELEKMGMELFNSDKAKCSSCHGGGNMSALDGPNDPYGGGGSFTAVQDLRGATNIGLDIVYKDNGLGNGKFKIPSLRNIELTGPYMHDGRFKTLEEVVNHYTNGIKPHQHLDVKFTDGKGNVKPLNLNSIEKKAIIAFLKTLTDQEMTKDPKWSNPFRS